MTLQQFARRIVDDPAYQETVIARAHAGTLPPDIELFLWETAADLSPLAAAPPQQSRTFAIIRPAGEVQR